MSPRIVCLCLFSACLATAASAAAEKKSAGTIVRHAAPADPDLTIYYFGLITKGENFDAFDQEDRARIQAAHVHNVERLVKAGKLLVAGPFTDDRDWRGIFIYKCASLEEARALAASDPAVKTGRYQIEVRPWMTEKGSIRDPEFPPGK